MINILVFIVYVDGINLAAHDAEAEVAEVKLSRTRLSALCLFCRCSPPDNNRIHSSTYTDCLPNHSFF